MAKKILLGNDQFAIVDDEDYELLMKFKWRAITSGVYGHFYANTTIKMHRFILDAPKGYVVDHINGDTLDNRKQNLRICTHAQNQQNTGSRGGSSKYKGVCFKKAQGKWQGQFRGNGVKYYCGLFDTEEAAARAVDKKRREICGEFASQNLDEED